MRTIICCILLQLSICASTWATVALPPIGHPTNSNAFYAEVDFPAAVNSGDRVQSSTAAYLPPLLTSASAGSKTNSIADPNYDYGQAFAQAGQNSLKGYSAINAGSASFADNTVSRFNVNDLMFSGSTPMVHTSLNLHIDGALFLSPSGFMNSVATAGVGFSYQITDGGTTVYSSGTGSASAARTASSQHNVYASQDLLSGAVPATNYLTFDSLMTETDVNFDFKTDSFDVPTTSAVTLILELDTSASFQRNSDVFGGSAKSDFSNTLKFSTTGPVFNNENTVAGLADPLFSANSVQGGVLLNSAVPEPASILTMLLPTTLLMRPKSRR